MTTFPTVSPFVDEAIWEPVSSLKIRSCSSRRPGSSGERYPDAKPTEVSIGDTPNMEGFSDGKSTQQIDDLIWGTPNVRKPPSLNSQSEIRTRLSLHWDLFLFLDVTLEVRHSLQGCGLCDLHSYTVGDTDHNMSLSHNIRGTPFCGDLHWKKYEWLSFIGFRGSTFWNTQPRIAPCHTMDIHPAWHSMAPAKLRRDRRTASQWYVSWVAADISGWSAQFILVPVWDFDILDIPPKKTWQTHPQISKHISTGNPQLILQLQLVPKQLMLSSALHCPRSIR